jgi:hypothetical protein
MKTAAKQQRTHSQITNLGLPTVSNVGQEYSMLLTVAFTLGTGVGLFSTHRSEEPKKNLDMERNERDSEFTCIKLDQKI